MSRSGSDSEDDSELDLFSDDDDDFSDDDSDDDDSYDDDDDSYPSSEDDDPEVDFVGSQTGSKTFLAVDLGQYRTRCGKIATEDDDLDEEPADLLEGVSGYSRGRVTDYDLLIKALEAGTELKSCSAVALAYGTPEATRRARTAEMLFERGGQEEVLLLTQGTAALYASGRTTGDD